MNQTLEKSRYESIYSDLTIKILDNVLQSQVLPNIKIKKEGQRRELSPELFIINPSTHSQNQKCYKHSFYFENALHCIERYINKMSKAITEQAQPIKLSIFEMQKNKMIS